MRRYETIFIVDPEISEEGRDSVFERLKDLIQQHNDFLAAVDEWGNRKLAYDIKKKNRGYYVRLDYCGAGALVNEIERFFRIDDRILKYMTVLLDKEVDLDRLKLEIARAEAEARSIAEAQALARKESQDTNTENAGPTEEAEASTTDQHPDIPPEAETQDSSTPLSENPENDKEEQ